MRRSKEWHKITNTHNENERDNTAKLCGKEENTTNAKSKKRNQEEKKCVTIKSVQKKNGAERVSTHTYVWSVTYRPST